MTDIDLNELEAKAKAATGDEWVREWPAPDDPYSHPTILDRDDYDRVVTAKDKGEETRLDDFDYIAAADPETVLALIERIRELESDNASTDAAHEAEKLACVVRYELRRRPDVYWLADEIYKLMGESDG